MLFKRMKIAFKNNKIVLYLIVVIIINAMINSLEDYILDHIALISKQPIEYEENNLGNLSCPYIPNYEGHHHKVITHTTFYWTEQQIASVNIIRYNIPFFTILFGGIFSDKFGGQRVVLVGLMLCSAVMSTCYLFMFNNNYIFLAMLVLRKASKGLILGGFFSLGGKLSKQDQRSIFVSVLLAAQSIGFFLSNILSTIVVKWEPISLFSGFVSFGTGISWWIIYRSSQFPKVRKIKHIRWKAVMTTVSLYAICFLLISCYLIMFVAQSEYKIYGKQVLSLKVNREWILKLVLFLTSLFSFFFCGFSSDYIISKKYLPASTVRRIFYSLCIIIVFCTLVVVTLAKCNRIVVVACSVPLHFTSAIAWSTTLTAAIDFSPLCSGAITGVVFMFSIVVYFPLYSKLRDIFVSGDYESDINNWIELLFTLFFLSLVSSLLFICRGIKETSPGIEASLRMQDKNNKLDDPTVSESAPVGQQKSVHSTNSGPSNI